MGMSVRGVLGRSCGVVLGAGAVAAVTLAGPSPAQASPLSRVTLTDQGGRWLMAGSALSPGRTDNQVWVMNKASWTTLEYQSGIATSAVTFPRAGRLVARGTQHFVPGSGLIPDGMWTDHPLACGTSYQPVVFNPSDGYVYGAVLQTAACPILH